MSAKLIKTVLLVEDNAGDARLLREMFYEQGSRDTNLIHVTCMVDAETYIAANTVDIVLLDLGLPDAQGLEALRRVRTAAPRVPLVVLTGLDDESLAAQAMQEGAQDYLIKGQIETRALIRALRYAIERKRLDQLKDEFVSSVSHELRTPLTSIAGSLGLLMANAGALPEPAAHLLEIAHRNSQRLVRLVNDILDIEKMESGRVAFDFKKVEVRSIAAEAIEANRGFADGCGVRVRLDDAAAVVDVRADPDRLAQVVTNLLSNAIKFSSADNEVVVAVEKETDIVRISVRDHGPGIPAAFRPRIFERFAQADAGDARQKSGTGLGLSIVKQIVDRLGGKVGFIDAPGGGTIFHVDLPCWKGAACMAVDIDSHPSALHLLLCDDDPDTAILLRQRLNQVGFALDFAYTAADAMTCAAATRYHAVLVDLGLPDGDGISLIIQLRELPQYSPSSDVSADMNVRKAPKAAPIDDPWATVWGAAYGGYNRTDGDPVTGSHDLTARAGGFAAGADYHVSRDTVLGAAIAVGEANWGLSAGLGKGKSEFVQVGGYGSTRWGAAYLSAGVAGAFYRASTDRFVSITGTDHLRADFDAQSIGARLEGGWRFGSPTLGLTPYAAVQMQSVHTPTYGESAASGSSVFALNVASQTTTDTRSELGAWVDTRALLTNGDTLILRGRAAWLHDFDPDRRVTPLFQTLPGASFVVNGAAAAKDAMLVSAGAELRLANGVSFGGKFDGEFAGRSNSYSGTGTMRVAW